MMDCPKVKQWLTLHRDNNESADALLHPKFTQDLVGWCNEAHIKNSFKNVSKAQVDIREKTKYRRQKRSVKPVEGPAAKRIKLETETAVTFSTLEPNSGVELLVEIKEETPVDVVDPLDGVSNAVDSPDSSDDAIAGAEVIPDANQSAGTSTAVDSLNGKLSELSARNIFLEKSLLEYQAQLASATTLAAQKGTVIDELT